MALYILGVFGLVVAVGALILVKVTDHRHHKKA